MATPRPISSDQWLARLGLVAALGASEVVLAAICGIGGLRLIAVAIAALGFVLALVLAPSPGQPAYDALEMRPGHAMRAATLAAAAVSGGLASPFAPLLLAPIAIAWTMRRPGAREVGVTVGLLALLAPVTSPIPHVPTGQLALLAG